MSSWFELTSLTRNRPFVVTEVGLNGSDVKIRGEFELPQLAKLSDEDQVFVAHFIRTHGSIKEMEQAFGVSYPTIKNRLNKIAEQLSLVVPKKQPSESDILSQLEKGEITAKEAIERLKK
ncbi:MAG: DUF2089 domain-containing protein [Fibrobacteres bacterium]|nr:DUF2089 domain-containing protein [Fibrobacterota bacterium]